MPGYRKKRQSLAIRIGKKFLEWQKGSLKKDQTLWKTVSVYGLIRQIFSFLHCSV